MERNNFNQPNFELGPSGSNSEVDDDKKKSKKSKLSKAVGRERSDAAQAEAGDKKQEVAERLTAAPETIWQRIIGERDAAKGSEEKPAAARASAEAAPEAAEADEKAAPLEALSAEETRLAASVHIAERQAQVAAEYAAAVEAGDEATATELAADAALLEAMQAELNNQGEEPAEEAIEAAYDETAQAVTVESRDGGAEDELADNEDNVDDTAAQMRTLPVAPSSTKAAPGVVPPAGRAPGGPTGGGAGRGVAPAPGGFGGAGVPGGPGGNYGAVPALNIYGRAPARNKNAAKANQAPTIIEQHGGSALLVGGIIGYLIGRRRGRIKTEKRLGAVQQKLEKQMAEVQQQVYQKEEQIKKLVRSAEPGPLGRAVEQAVAARAESLPPSRTERLGLVSLKAIEQAPAGPRLSAEAVRRAPEHQVPAAEMQREELLAASNAITMGETNLRRVYETRLISEQGLRRLVEVYQKGGDVRRELDKELLEKERSYERDPRMRNRAAGPLGGGGTAAGKSTLVAAIGASSAAAYQKRQTAAPLPPATQANAQSVQKRQVDLATTAGVVLLFVIITLIYMVLTR